VDLWAERRVVSIRASLSLPSLRRFDKLTASRLRSRLPPSLVELWRDRSPRLRRASPSAGLPSPLLASPRQASRFCSRLRPRLRRASPSTSLPSTLREPPLEFPRDRQDKQAQDKQDRRGRPGFVTTPPRQAGQATSPFEFLGTSTASAGQAGRRRQASASGSSGGPGGGESELNIATEASHLPPSCLRRTTRYLPISFTGSGRPGTSTVAE
jgi:hypothetical protein